MNVKQKYSIGKDLDFCIVVISASLLAITIVLALIAAFDKGATGEAPMGSFNVSDFNESWTLSINDEEKEITLPYNFEVSEGQTGTIINILPDGLTDDMSFLIRASMEDMYVYVDDVLRAEYSTESLNGTSYYLPSAYVVTQLNHEDSGKPVRIEITFKSQGIINKVSIGSGNDVWYPIFVNNFLVNLAAIIVVILGVVLSATVAFLNKSFKRYHAARYLGLLMIDIGLWVLSESNLRQFIFPHASITSSFAYLSVELTGVFALLYFDEVQHRKYHKIYRVGEGVMLAQVLLNVVLYLTHIVEMYKTLVFSHIWLAIGIVMVIASVIWDTVTKDVKNYKITAIGIAAFLVLSVMELAGFYYTQNHVFGIFACIGLIALMTFTIVQALYDEMISSLIREKKQLEMVSNTIETIASSIDAKDEYTGGHSERVGIYAEKLARKVAVDYGFSEEDILRIKYIGFVHDIGKMGVADTVLNKAGRLTDEEFSLMKKHTEIGYEIMKATGEIIDGLLDGIRYHHERFDGKGYPEGLAYTDIPLIARILSLADSYDAMTSNRVYRKRLSDEEVKNELLRCAGSQFDPALTNAFVSLIEDGELGISTENGMATDSNGNVLLSAKLENYLHNDLLQKKDILNPTHVRMMCYVIKLMEKKDKKIDVIFYPSDANDVIKPFLSGQDMVIGYSSDTNVVAVFEKESHEIEAAINTIKEMNSSDTVFALK